MATAQPRLITADEFLAIEWPDSDVKAELDNGVIRVLRMMAGGSIAHSRVQRNIIVALDIALRGTGCSPHGSDLAIRTTDFDIRYPDVSVFCGHWEATEDKVRAFDDPRLVVEVLSPSTREKDLTDKLEEYRALPKLGQILYVDPDAESLRLWTRMARGWYDEELAPGEDVDLAALGIRLAWADIFARR